MSSASPQHLPSDTPLSDTLSVVVCTYRRPDNLDRCLHGIAAQTRQPDEVLVVVRDTDTASLDYLRQRSPEPLSLRTVLVSEPGLVAARNAGLLASRTDLLTFTDDDAIPRPDWLDRIARHFAEDPRLGGLGGRDQCFTEGAAQPASRDLVGKLLWTGKHIGNHHLGRGAARPVDLLKGVNMSYRREALAPIGFDRRLRGSGSQACEDMSVSRSVALAGWTLLYDPAVLVDHYEGARDEPRHYAAQVLTDRTGFSDSVYNQAVATWNGRSTLQRLAALLFFFFVGTRATPGLLQALRFTPSLGRTAWTRFRITQRARFEAFRDLSRAATPSHGQSR